MAVDVTKIAKPGKSMRSGAIWNQCVTSDSIPPQVGVGGRTPTPRKDSAASNRMLVGISKVA